MKLITILLTIAVGLTMSLSAVAKQAKVEGPMLKPEEFAILPWGGTPGNLDVLNEIKQCGFNLAGFVAVSDLDAVSEAGLQCLVSDGSVHVGDTEAKLDQAEIDKRVQALVDRVKDHKAVYGFYLRDEPGANAFPGLGRWAAAFAKAAPKALPYINLLPNYATPGQLNAETYDGYLESFVEKVHPKFISYDHYALMDDGTLRGGYFQNLESMRAAALRHNLPFWNIVLSNSHFHYAEPTPAGFRFQAYTTLAYGARGISYFTYFAPQIGNYRLAPIDQHGNKTLTWDMLRDVNMQIHRLGPTYLKLKSINVFHDPEVPEGCSGIATSKLLKSVSGGNFLVGEFEGPDGQPFVMIVNKDLHRSAPFAVEFKDAGHIQKVNAYTGSIGNLGGEDDWLAAGQGALLCLAK